MTEKLNKEIKWAKSIRIVLVAVLCIVIAAAAGWFVLWNQCKKSVEGKFIEGLSKYEYTVDETCSKGGYYLINYDDDTYFALPNQTMPGYFDFSTDFHGKDVDCYTMIHGDEISICWNGAEEKGQLVPKVFVNGMQVGENELEGKYDFDDLLKYGETLYKSVYK